MSLSMGAETISYVRSDGHESEFEALGPAALGVQLGKNLQSNTAIMFVDGRPWAVADCGQEGFLYETVEYLVKRNQLSHRLVRDRYGRYFHRVKGFSVKREQATLLPYSEAVEIHGQSAGSCLLLKGW